MRDRLQAKLLPRRATTTAPANTPAAAVSRVKRTGIATVGRPPIAIVTTTTELVTVTKQRAVRVMATMETATRAHPVL